jgi:hypothetical protein
VTRCKFQVHLPHHANRALPSVQHHLNHRNQPQGVPNKTRFNLSGQNLLMMMATRVRTTMMEPKCSPLPHQMAALSFGGDLNFPLKVCLSFAFSLIRLPKDPRYALDRKFCFCTVPSDLNTRDRKLNLLPWALKTGLSDLVGIGREEPHFQIRLFITPQPGKTLRRSCYILRYGARQMLNIMSSVLSCVNRCLSMRRRNCTVSNKNMASVFLVLLHATPPLLDQIHHGSIRH